MSENDTSTHKCLTMPTDSIRGVSIDVYPDERFPNTAAWLYTHDSGDSVRINFCPFCGRDFMKDGP